MRNQPPFECPSCGASSPVGVSCDGCDVMLLDQNGQPPLAPPLRILREGAILRGRPFLVWRSLFEDRRRTRRARRMREEVAARRIALVDEPGLARVRGRVVPLEPVVAPGAVPAGAFLSRRIHVTSERRQGRHGEYFVHTSELEESSSCGRFAVVDGSGVAIVDDDCFDVWRLEGERLRVFDNGLLAAREGDEVEVIGPARRGHAREAVRLGTTDQGGYREANAALLFEGAPDRRVLILV